MGVKRRKGRRVAPQVPDAPPEPPAAQEGGNAAPSYREAVFSHSHDRLSLAELTVAAVRERILEPLDLVERDWRREIWPLLAVFAFAFCLYGITTPRKVTLEDDGLFLMNLEFFGVPHPPGYPIYSLLGGAFYHLMPEFLPPALRGHLFSGFSAAVACSFIYMCVAMLTRSRWPAFISGLAYGASEAFWSQAIIAEVYTLNAMFYFMILALCLRYASHRGPPTNGHRALYAAIAFIYGLGLSNHWPLLGLGSPVLLLIVLSQWRTLLTRLPLGLLCLGIGLTPYLWLVWRSTTDVPINFYGEIEDLKALWFYITRSGYTGVDNQEGVGLDEKLAFASFFLAQFAKQITWAGFAVAVAGMVAMLRSRAHFLLAFYLLGAMVMTGPLLIILLDFKSEFIWFSAFRVYHLLCYGIMVIFFGYGLAWCGDYLLARMKAARKATAAVAGFGSMVVVASLALHWGQNDRSDYSWAHELAMVKLLAVEPNTQLFTFDDLDLPVAYLNYVEGVRPDVTVYNDQGLVFGNRIYTPFTSEPQRARLLASFVDVHPDVPVYYHTHRTEMFKSATHGSDLMGFWRRVHKDGPDDRVILSERLRLWLENNLQTVDTIKDRWTKQSIYGSIATLVNTIEQAGRNGFPLSPEWQEVIEVGRRKNALVRLVSIWTAVSQRSLSQVQAREDIEWINGMLDQRSDDQIFTNQNWADALAVKAQILLDYPQLASTDDYAAEIEDTLRLALDYEFTPTSFTYLTDILRGQGRHDDLVEALRDEFPEISKAPPKIRELYNLVIKEQKENRLLRPVIEIDGLPRNPQDSR